MDSRIRLAERSGDKERLQAEKRRAGLDPESILRRDVRACSDESVAALGVRVGLVEIWTVKAFYEDTGYRGRNLLIVEAVNHKGIERVARLNSHSAKFFLQAMVWNHSTQLQVKITFSKPFKNQPVEF